MKQALETAVDENNFLTNREDQVRRAWEIDRVESVAVPESMYKTPDGDLRLGIFERTLAMFNERRLASR